MSFRFRLRLSEELAAQYAVNVSARSCQGNPCARLDKFLDHFPEHREVTQERTAKQDRFKCGRCVRCAARKEKKQTNITCSQCKVFLCVGQCWKEFHTLESV